MLVHLQIFCHSCIGSAPHASLPTVSTRDVGEPVHLCAWAGTLLSQQCPQQQCQDAAAAAQSWGHSCSLQEPQLPAQPTTAHINKTLIFGFLKMQKFMQEYHPSRRKATLVSFHESLVFVSVQNTDYP